MVRRHLMAPTRCVYGTRGADSGDKVSVYLSRRADTQPTRPPASSSAASLFPSHLKTLLQRREIELREVSPASDLEESVSRQMMPPPPAPAATMHFPPTKLPTTSVTLTPIFNPPIPVANGTMDVKGKPALKTRHSTVPHGEIGE